MGKHQGLSSEYYNFYFIYSAGCQSFRLPTRPKSFSQHNLSQFSYIKIVSPTLEVKGILIFSNLQGKQKLVLKIGDS